MAGERILVVDDDLQSLKLARVLLAREGYDVRTAVDAEETLAVLETFRPRVIFMDLQLSGMDGVELARRVKSNPATRGIPVVALTAYSLKRDEERARAVCDDYIAKPMDADTLPKWLAAFLAGAASPTEKLP